MRRSFFLGSVCVSLLLAGCQMPFSEVKYLKVKPPAGKETDPEYATNYFRVKIDGWSFLSSARYVSGIFDENAVNTYFAEFRQPENFLDPKATGKQKNKPTTRAEVKAAGTLSALEDEDPITNGTFVLLLSSNTDAITSNINALAESEDIAKTLVAVSNRDVFKQAADAKVAADAQKGVGTVLADRGKLIADKKNAEVTDAELLAYVNDLAASLGHVTPFVSLKSAQEWVASQSTLTGGGQ